MSMTSNPAPQVWFLTGSQGLYGPETLDQVAVAVAGRSSRAWSSSRTCPWTWSGSRCCSTPSRSTGRCWRPTPTRRASASSPGCTPSPRRRCGSPASTRCSKPLLHLHTQAGMALPWSTIDMDFMNLNQAAHGDREFGYIQSRLGVARKTVAGHVESPVVGERIAHWARAALGRHELRNLKLARFGDNMRDVAVTEGDKVEAQLRFGVSVNTYGVNDLVAVVDAGRRARGRQARRPSTPTPTASRPSCCPTATGTSRCATAPASSWACVPSSTRAASAPSPRTSRTSAVCGSCPGLAVQRLMADGYGFGGEGDWKTSVLLRATKVMAAGLPGGTSFMEDYTYHLVPGEEKILGAHMLEVCPTITTQQPSLEIHPLSIGGREDPVRLRFTADPGPGRGRRALRPRRPVPAHRQRDRRRRAGRGAAATFPSPARCGSRGRRCRPRPRPG